VEEEYTHVYSEVLGSGRGPASELGWPRVGGWVGGASMVDKLPAVDALIPLGRKRESAWPSYLHTPAVFV